MLFCWRLNRQKENLFDTAFIPCPVFSPLKEFLYPYYPSRGDLGGKCEQEAMKIYCEKTQAKKESTKGVLCEEGDIATVYDDGKVNVL